MGLRVTLMPLAKVISNSPGLSKREARLNLCVPGRWFVSSTGLAAYGPLRGVLLAPDVRLSLPSARENHACASCVKYVAEKCVSLCGARTRQKSSISISRVSLRGQAGRHNVVELWIRSHLRARLLSRRIVSPKSLSTMALNSTSAATWAAGLSYAGR